MNTNVPLTKGYKRLQIWIRLLDGKPELEELRIALEQIADGTDAKTALGLKLSRGNNAKKTHGPPTVIEINMTTTLRNALAYFNNLKFIRIGFIQN